MPCAQALLASLVPYRKDGGNFQDMFPAPLVTLLRCTRSCYVKTHTDLADAAANPELFSNEREPPNHHRYASNHSVRPLFAARS